MDPHNINAFLYSADHVLPDPGDAKTITVRENLLICEMKSVTAETRTLANPVKAGIRFCLRMLTDGGDIVVTASNGLNATAGEIKATFNDVGDMLCLLSVETATLGTFRWQVQNRRITFLP